MSDPQPPPPPTTTSPEPSRSANFTAVNNNTASIPVALEPSQEPPTQQVAVPQNQSLFGGVIETPIRRPNQHAPATPEVNAVTAAVVSATVQEVTATTAIEAQQQQQQQQQQQGLMQSPQNRQTDTWMEDASSSSPGGHKRKRSITPTTQTQHHHLAAHEAALGAVPQLQIPQQFPPTAMIGDDDDDERDSLRGMDSQSPHPHVHRDPVTGVQVDQKRRKRVFSNRTKTGCITCRRRKKKCDEGKPECSNCKRGGFVCEGYSGKVSWQKPPNKAAPTPLVTAPPFIQAKEEPNINHSVGTIMATGSATPSSHSHVTLDNSVTPTPAPQNILPYRTEVSTPTSTAPVDPSAPSGVGFSHVTNPAAGSASSNRRSEKEKMMSSQLYMACDPELTADREICKAACFRFNNIAANPMNAISPAEKGRMLHDILRPGQNWTAVPSPTVAGQPMFTYTSDNGYNSDLQDIQVDAPFHCSYGYNIRMGKSVLIEFGCTILDSCVVTIKARTILSPGCKIYSATHPIDPRKRNGSRGPECAKPVTIEEDCWLGGGVTVLGGITIGKGSVVGAGSVVTRDVPPFTVVAGNPARVIRGIYHNGVDH